ncbi:hypothetical protein T12_7345 [Trichinella patagoniensis]|uniref:Uncharacterized protein n=1 Tax=Trichinella patagoniensis TaxID=990121 RepID=A0A0V0X4M8_9BILA|nr:hypothetical protein T12_7345 [Trichinella patagoniensis]
MSKTLALVIESARKQALERSINLLPVVRANPNGGGLGE